VQALQAVWSTVVTPSYRHAASRGLDIQQMQALSYISQIPFLFVLIFARNLQLCCIGFSCSQMN
jgi:hypothetical protein